MTQLLPSKPETAASYSDALARAQASCSQDQEEHVRQVCLPALMTHGAPTDWALVFLHGFTNCPEQFRELGRRLFELGHNVYIPRQPYHGLAAPLENHLSPVKAEILVAYGEQALDLAHGLGQRVMVVGFSGGGTVAAWLAQNRSDLDSAVIIAAMMGVSFIPALLTRPSAWLMSHLPDFYMWKDPRRREKNPHTVDYAYPGYSFHGMSEVLRLGISVRDQARTAPPSAKKITLVFNDREPGVNNKELLNCLADWQAHRSQTVLSAYHFEPDLKLPHDFLSIGTPGLQVEPIYQRLIPIILDGMQ
jgi:pimeloyl-ACP methyl ester carboxylesterase